MPFEVPEGWCWCRLDEVADVARGGSPRPIKQYLTDSPDGVNWIKIGDTTEGSKYIEKTVEKIIPEGVRHSRMVKEGDFLLTNSMSFGKPFILKTNGCIHDGWLVISPFEGSFDKDYLYYLLSSGFAYDQFSDKASGAVVSNLNKDKVAESLFPLPPFEEQKKIVCQIESIMNFIDRMENNLEDVSTLVDRCKSRILNLAIHGKLVQQDANDEPASELLKRINPKAIASCDNPHYTDLPRGWVILKGKDLFKPMKSTKPSGETFKYIDIDSINNKNGVVTAPKILKSSDAPSRATRFTVKGDIVFSMVRPYLRNIAIVPENGCIASTGFYVCSPNGVMSSDYCYYLMTSNYVVEGLNKYMKGDNSPSINNNHINEWLFPVPPLKEQLRIVSKLQDILSPLDSIMSSLQA